MKKLCITANCGKKVHAKHLCKTCYDRIRNHRKPDNEDQTCAHPNCDRIATRLGYCTMHYQRLRRNGSAQVKYKDGSPKRARHDPDEEEFDDVCMASAHCQRMGIWHTHIGPVCDHHFQKMKAKQQKKERQPA